MSSSSSDGFTALPKANRGAAGGLRDGWEGPAFEEDGFLPSPLDLAETSSLHFWRNDSNSGLESSIGYSGVQFKRMSDL